MVPQYEPQDGASPGEYYRTDDDDVAATTRDQLLAEVLKETLMRRRDNPSDLVRSLCGWRSRLEDVSFSQSLCVGIVGQVLEHRLGSKAERLPEQLCQDVGAVLWENPTSRARIEKFWNALGTMQ